VPSEHEARILLKRVTHLRELITELEIDSIEWSCDAQIRLAFERMKRQADDATLAIALFQRMREH
jgi:hypothetical protein